MVGRRHEPVRTCIVCRRKKNKRELVRLALTDDVVVVDLKQKMPGRGAYVCSSQCMEDAATNVKGCLNRAFRLGRKRVWFERPDQIFIAPVLPARG